MGVGAMTVLEQEDGAVIDAGALPDLFQDLFDTLIEIPRGKVDEFCGNFRDQVVESNPGAEGWPGGSGMVSLP